MPTNNPQQTTQQQIARAAEGATKAAERLETSAEHATSVAIEKVRQVRDEAQSGIEQQRDQIADRIRRIGGVLRSGSQTLSTDDPLSQQLFETAGDSVERIAEYIGNITPGELASDVQSLARRRPGLFFGGSFILGLALGRFAKSSAAALGGSNGELDDYEQTLTVRRAPQRKAPQRQSAPRTQGARSSTQTARSSTQTAPTSASPAYATPSTLPQGVSSSVHGTTGTGSAHSPAPNAAPSYGAASGAVARPQGEQLPASGRTHSVEPGEGSKS